jgi:hypothetical protein
MNKTQIALILVVLLASSGVSYYVGQSPIPEIQAKMATVEADNLKLETQFSALEANYQELLTEMKAVSSNLTQQTKTISTLTENMDQNKNDYDETLTKYNTLLSDYYTQLLEYQGASAPNGATAIATKIPGIENGGFDGVGDPWVMQGWGGKSPYAALWQNDRGSYVTQNIQLSSSVDGLVFDLKPEPQGASVTIQLQVGETILFSKQYQGSSSLYTWKQEAIDLKPLFSMREAYGFNTTATYQIRFTVLAGPETTARVLIDNVSLASLTYSPP